MRAREIDLANTLSIRDHINFLGTFVDCAPQGTQMEDQIGTVDLENLSVISF